MTVYKNNNEKLYSVLFFVTTGSAQATVKLFEGVALLTLEERYNAATKELRRSFSEKLPSRTLKRKEDQQRFLYG